MSMNRTKQQKWGTPRPVGFFRGFVSSAYLLWFFITVSFVFDLIKIVAVALLSQGTKKRKTQIMTPQHQQGQKQNDDGKGPAMCGVAFYNKLSAKSLPQSPNKDIWIMSLTTSIQDVRESIAEILMGTLPPWQPSGRRQVVVGRDILLFVGDGDEVLTDSIVPATVSAGAPTAGATTLQQEPLTLVHLLKQDQDAGEAGVGESGKGHGANAETGGDADRHGAASESGDSSSRPLDEAQPDLVIRYVMKAVSEYEPFENRGSLISALRPFKCDVPDAPELERRAKVEEKYGPIRYWDLSRIENLSWLLSGAEMFNIDISGWDVSGATDMSYMFCQCGTFNQPIGNWNVQNVTTMECM
ncbi:unnamed protein product [Amoebophrya sp. A120]|nr:unnamed protein product [Amoebophrya sp. A120]|eukprot:GSA120T00015201001.1